MKQLNSKNRKRKPHVSPGVFRTNETSIPRCQGIRYAGKTNQESALRTMGMECNTYGHLLNESKFPEDSGL